MDTSPSKSAPSEVNSGGPGSPSTMGMDFKSFVEMSGQDLAVTRDEMVGEIAAVKRTNGRSNQRISEVGEQIIEIQNRAAQAIELLESRGEDLTEKYDELAEENENLPPIEFYNDQIAIMEEMANAEPSFDPDVFIELGLLRPGQGASVLRAQIENLIHRQTPVKVPGMSKARYNSFRLFTEGSLQKLSANVAQSRREVEELEYLLSQLE